MHAAKDPVRLIGDRRFLKKKKGATGIGSDV